jgi:hypothetical protein
MLGALLPDKILKVCHIHMPGVVRYSSVKGRPAAQCLCHSSIGIHCAQMQYASLSSLVNIVTHHHSLTYLTRRKQHSLQEDVTQHRLQELLVPLAAYPAALIAIT